MTHSYKLIKPLQLSGKMEVTPEQSETIQRILFDMGYDWDFIPEFSEYDLFKNLGQPFITWELNKEIMHYAKGQQALFVLDENPLHLFNDYFETI